MGGILARLSSPCGTKCLGRGKIEPSASSWSFQEHSYTNLNTDYWQGCAEYQVKGEKVPGHTVAALPLKPSCSRNNESPVQVSLEHAKEM